MKESPENHFNVLVDFLKSWGMDESETENFSIYLNSTCFNKMLNEANNKLQKYEVEFIKKEFVINNQNLNALNTSKAYFFDRFLSVYQTGNQTREDAELRANALMGCQDNNPSKEYLIALRNELISYADSIDRQLWNVYKWRGGLYESS